MIAKIVRMPPLIVLTDEDLEIAEDACRANAARCLRKGDFERGASWTRVADNIARARPPRCRNKYL